jgi:hypothetical protein
LNERSIWFSRRHQEGLFSAVSAGFFFLLVGTIFVTTPNLLDDVLKLFNSGVIRWNTPVPNTAIYLPAPTSPDAHRVIYHVAGLFSLFWGIFEISMLVLRFSFHSPMRKKAENAGNIAFWLGTSYLINIYLNKTGTITTTTWFSFWTVMLMLFGVSFIVRAAVLAAMRFGI